MDKAERTLSRVDPIMRRLITRHGPCTLKRHKDAFLLLCIAIISQQISNKAAVSITKRWKALYQERPTPAKVFATDDERLRGAGVSPQKQRYLKDLARHFVEKKIKPATFDALSDEEIITELVAVKGIGRWTAEMFLIFSLARPDVFAFDDLGLRKTVERLYNKGRPLSRERLISISDKWRPYRSVASWYLWASVDAKTKKEEKVW